MPKAAAPWVVMLPVIGLVSTQAPVLLSCLHKFTVLLLPPGPPRVALPVDVARPPPPAILCATMPTEAPPEVVIVAPLATMTAALSPALPALVAPPSTTLLARTRLSPPPPPMLWATMPADNVEAVVTLPIALTLTSPPTPPLPPDPPSAMVPVKRLELDVAAAATPPPPPTLWATRPTEFSPVVKTFP